MRSAWAGGTRDAGMLADGVERKRKEARSSGSRSSGSRSSSSPAQGAAPAMAHALPSATEQGRHSSPERALPSVGEADGLVAASERRACGDAGMVDLDAVLDQANLRYVEQHNKVSPACRAQQAPAALSPRTKESQRRAGPPPRTRLRLRAHPALLRPLGRA
jgi:hypothetical protein